MGQRDLIEGRQRGFFGTFGDDDHAVTNKDDALALEAMIGQHRIVFIDSKEDHASFALLGHLGCQWVVGFEDTETALVNGLDDASLDFGELFNRLDIRETQVVAFADVGHDTDIAEVKAETFTKDTSASRFEHSGFDKRVHQNRSAALWATAIAGIDATTSDVDTIGAGHSDFLAGACNDVSDQACGGRLAVDPCDADDRDPSVA